MRRYRLEGTGPYRLTRDKAPVPEPGAGEVLLRMRAARATPLVAWFLVARSWLI